MATSKNVLLEKELLTHICGQLCRCYFVFIFINMLRSLDTTSILDFNILFDVPLTQESFKAFVYQKFK